MDIPKTYCPYPFTHLHVAPTLASPCCRFFNPTDSYAMASSSVSEIFNHPVMNRIRKDMLDGKYIKGCEQCYGVEERGLTSARQDAIGEYGLLTTSKLYSLDITFSNLCNLKCRMCNSINAHKLKKDEIEIYGRPLVRVDKKYVINQSLDDIDYSGLKRVNISGGELFINKATERFLTNLKDNKYIQNIRFSVNTNATVYPSKKIVEAFQSSKETFIILSIDAFGKLNDFCRSGSDFEQIKQVIDFYKELSANNSNIRIGVNTTVSTYNVNMLDPLLDFFADYCPTFELMRRPVNVSPKSLSIQHLPMDLKLEIYKVLKASKYNMDDIITFLEQPGDSYFEHFLNYHFKLNELRKEEFIGLNPLLETYIEQYVVAHPKRIDSTEFFNQEAKVMLE